MPSVNSKYNHKVLDLMISSFKVLDELWDEERLGRRWLSLANYDLATAVQVIKEAVMDQSVEKHIIVQVFQKYIGHVDVQILIQHMRDIRDVAKKQSLNRIGFSTCWFPPAEEKVWGAIGIFNLEAHRINEDLQVPRINLHRSVMSQKSRTDQSLRTRPAMWACHQMGIGLGKYLSYEGQEHVVRTVIKVFDTAFGAHSYKGRGRTTQKVVPPPLDQTVGYYDDEFMFQLIEDNRGRPRSTGGERRTRRLQYSNQRMPGWRRWHVFRKHGNLWNIGCREGILESLKYLTNQSDPKPVWNKGTEPKANEEEYLIDQVEEGIRDIEVVEASDDDSVFEEAAEMEEDSDDDPIFKEEARPVPIWRKASCKETTKEVKDSAVSEEKEKSAVKEKKREREDSIESDQVDNDKTTKLLELARDKIKDSERMLTVADERIKAFKKERNKKDEIITKEKAATRYWKDLANSKQEECEQLLDQLQRVQEKLEKEKAEVERVTKMYDAVLLVCEEQLARNERKMMKFSKRKH